MSGRKTPGCSKVANATRSSLRPQRKGTNIRQGRGKLETGFGELTFEFVLKRQHSPESAEAGH